MRLANPLLHTLEILYGFLIKVGSNLQSLFLLYMRCTWGHQFILTGLNKLHNVEQTAKFFAALHIAHPYFHTYLVGWLEVIGGACLFIGFASRLVSIPLAFIMLGALGTAHAPNISNFRFLLEPLSLVREAPYPFLITGLMVFVFGPGRISVDAWLKRWSEKRPKY